MESKNWHKSNNIGEAIVYAFRGIQEVFYREQNVRIQAAVGTLVVCMMIIFRVPLAQMALLLLCIALVITLEMINTSLELFANMVHSQYSETIRSIKDILAGAVLLASISACIVGALVFIPAIIHYFSVL
jgi:undecaprenol kinase